MNIDVPECVTSLSESETLRHPFAAVDKAKAGARWAAISAIQRRHLHAWVSSVAHHTTAKTDQLRKHLPVGAISHHSRRWGRWHNRCRACSEEGVVRAEVPPPL